MHAGFVINIINNLSKDVIFRLFVVRSSLLYGCVLVHNLMKQSQAANYVFFALSLKVPYCGHSGKNTQIQVCKQWNCERAFDRNFAGPVFAVSVLAAVYCCFSRFFCLPLNILGCIVSRPVICQTSWRKSWRTPFMMFTLCRHLIGVRHI